MIPPRRLSGFLLALTLCGCASAPRCEQLAARPVVSPLAQRHIHVFLVNGHDPRGAILLANLRDDINELGYVHTYFCQMYHGVWCQGEMAKAARQDPDARFILIGHAGGAALLRDMAASVGDKVEVLLVLGEAYTLLDGSIAERPLPTDSVERRAHLAWELSEAASHVAVPDTTMPLPIDGPTPRGFSPQAMSYGPDWDCLQPKARLP